MLWKNVCLYKANLYIIFDKIIIFLKKSIR